jgi:hypothetical protein
MEWPPNQTSTQVIEEFDESDTAGHVRLFSGSNQKANEMIITPTDFTVIAQE